MVELKTFTEADWPAVYKIVQEISRRGDTFTYPKDISEELAKNIWVQPAPSHTIVAYVPDGILLGTAKMGPNQMGPGAHVATASFMVAADARGQGVGRALCEYALTWALHNGFKSMQFNAVVETNERAVTLWKSLGFEVIGTVPKAFDHAERGYVGLHIMHRSLC